jgi:hypothetical protein
MWANLTPFSLPVLSAAFGISAFKFSCVGVKDFPDFPQHEPLLVNH